MTKTFLKIIAFCLILISCSGQTESADSASIEIIENALTFELSFGDDNLPDEYLLAEAMGLAVNDVGDIYVFDEQSVKVYDSTGKEKEIMGGPGEGPGEFEFSGGSIPLTISNDGYLTVTDSKGSKYFSPDNKYVDIFTVRNNGIFDKLIQENDLLRLSDNKGLYLDSSQKIIEAAGHEIVKGVGSRSYSLLLYEYDTKYFEIANYKVVNSLQLVLRTDQNFTVPIKIVLPFRGELEWGLANSGEIAFSHPGHDNMNAGESNYYTLNVFDPSELNTRKIERLYEPVALADSVITNLDKNITNLSNRFSFITEKIANDALEGLHKKLEDNIYYAPFQKLLTDGNIIYVFTYDFKEANGFLTDIFDVGSMKYLRSAYFSIIPLTIKNGFAYRLSKSSDGFDIVEKYKIDPKVYGK